MKKTIKLLLIIVSLTLIVNVNAAVGDKYTINYIGKESSSKVKWSWGQEIAIEKFKVQKDGNDGSDAYCINAHANALGKGQILQETATINSQSAQELQGYIAIYQTQDKENYDGGIFLSALRAYTILATHLGSNMDGVTSDKQIKVNDRQSMYNQYVNLSRRLYSDLKSKYADVMTEPPAPTKPDKKTASGHLLTMVGDTYNNIKTLVEAGLEKKKNSTSGGGSSSVSGEIYYDSKSDNILKYKISNPSGIEIQILEVSGSSNTTFCTDSSYNSCSERYDHNGKIIYVKAEFNDGIQDGEGILSYKYSGDGSYQGAVLETTLDNKTYQKFLFINKANGDKIDTLNPDSSITDKCSNLTGLAKICCKNPDDSQCKCDKTKQDCDNLKNCDLSFDKNSLNCENTKDSTKPAPIAYDEKNNDVYKCVLAKGDSKGNSFEYKSSSVSGNPYCSVYCTESYEFEVPGKKVTKAGRYFNIDVTIKTARQDCYLSTARKFFEMDVENYSNIIKNGLDEYKTNEILKGLCTDTYDSEGNLMTTKQQCQKPYNDTLKEVYNEIKDASKTLEKIISDFKQCTDFNELDYTLDPKISFSYTEPNGTNKWVNELNTKGLNSMYTTQNISYRKEKFYCSSAESLNDLYDCYLEKPNKTTNIWYSMCTLNGYTDGLSYLELKNSCNTLLNDIPVYTYVKKSNYLSENIKYTTKRVFYNDSITGDVFISENQPEHKTKYSVIDGLPIGYTTPPGSYNYYVSVDNIGYYYDNYSENNKGRIFGSASNSVLNNTTTDEKYVCRYDITDGAACVKNDEKYYICNSDVYFGLKNKKDGYDLSMIGAWIGNGQCVESTEDEAACVTNDYNCKFVSKKCTTIITNLPGKQSTGDDRRDYEVSFKTISNSNVNPNKRTMGFNWNISSSNSLIARKAIDTINFISYRADAIAKQTTGGYNLQKFTEKDTTFKVHMDADLIQALRDYNDENPEYDNDTLNCVDYESQFTENECTDHAGYTWNGSKCVLDNIFCYSDVINKLIAGDPENNLGSRPSEDEQKNNISYKKFQNTSIKDDINNLNYYRVSGSTEIEDSKYDIITSSGGVKDYWSIYNFTTLDIDNDGLADAGPSWR